MNGDNTLSIKGFILDSQIFTGQGNNTLNLNKLVIDSTVNGDTGANVSEEEKNAARDTVARFLARWKGTATTQSTRV